MCPRCWWCHQPRCVRKDFFVVLLNRAPSQCVLSHAGLTTGLVLESGDGLTSVVPVVDGVAQLDKAQLLPLGGADVTAKLVRALPVEEGASPVLAELRARDIKASLCHVVLDPRHPSPLALPRGAPEAASVLGNKLYTVPEMCFTDPVGWPVMRELLIGRADAACILHRLPRDVFE